MKMTVFLLALLLCAAPALAADIDGKWSGSVSTPNGDFAVSFQFKAEGTTLTGTTAAPDGTSVPIKNGKVDGDKIAFTVTFDFGGMPVDIAYSGVVSGTDLKLTGDFGGMPFEFVVKKAS